MNQKNWMKMLVVVLLLSLVLVGCKQGDEPTVEATSDKVTVSDKTTQDEKDNKEGDSTVAYSFDGELTFTGFGQEFAMAYDEIFAMESAKRSVKHVSSTGEETTNVVVGVILESILSEMGLSQMDYSTLRFVAGDGYAIDVTADILKEKEVILAYEFDGKGLGEKKQPLRLAIDGVRSMYYVSNLVEIIAIEEATSEMKEVEVSQIIFLETAYEALTKEPFTYYESEDEAILASEIISSFVENETASVDFVASDGFAKSEDFNVVKDGFIKISGENAPLFTALDLPKGMSVKYIMKMGVAETSFISVGSALEGMTKTTMDDHEGVLLEDVISLAGLSGATYTLTANDGYMVEIAEEDISKGMIYIDEKSGNARARFGDGMPKNTNVKNLLTITASGESVIKAEKDQADESEVGQVLGEWLITVDGLSDGSFELASEKAQRKLDLVDLHTETIKNDEKKIKDWQGYKVKDILEFLHVESYSSLVITATDGFEVTLSAQQMETETILAVVKNGEPLSDADNMVQLVQNTEFMNTWVKGVSKITVIN